MAENVQTRTQSERDGTMLAYGRSDSFFGCNNVQERERKREGADSEREERKSPGSTVALSPENSGAEGRRTRGDMIEEPEVEDVVPSQ